MATRTSRLHLAATFLTIAGVILLATILLSFLSIFGIPFLFSVAALAYQVAIAIALFVLSTVITHRIARPALVVGGIGWALVALTTIAGVPGLPLVAELLAAAGMLVAAIVGLQNYLLPRRSSVGFLVSAIAAALFLFIFSFLGFILGVALIVTGILLRRDE